MAELQSDKEIAELKTLTESTAVGEQLKVILGTMEEESSTFWEDTARALADEVFDLKLEVAELKQKLRSYS